MVMVSHHKKLLILLKVMFKRTIKSLLSVLLNPLETRIVRKYQFSEDVGTNNHHMKLSANWLLFSQLSSPDKGYSRLYSLYKKKWDVSYIETTGYIIPTMIKVSEHLQDERYKESALQAADWLIDMQNQDGSFNDIDRGDKQVFDTGQCLLGLNFLQAYTHTQNFFDAAKKASDWLIAQQETDGSWVKQAYLGTPHTYYSRVAAALIEFGVMSKNQHYIESGLKNINWTISQQKDNGFFQHSSFHLNQSSVLHTLVYVLEGLLHAFKLTQKEYILQAIIKNAEQFKSINLHKSILLYAEYDEHYNATTHSKCVTGLAQWAGVCIDLYEITNDNDYLKIASRTIYYLKSKQIKEGKNTKGAFPGSIPFYANYGTSQLLNWNNKFFIDTLLKYDKYHITVDEEHQEWVSSSFSFIPEKISKKLSKADIEYLKKIEQALQKRSHKDTTLVDLGCGKGKFINYLEDKFPAVNIVGIEPLDQPRSDIKKGSAYAIPMPDNSADFIIVIEVLQHVRDINKAFKEINRVLKDDGTLIIGERNYYSGLGLLKRCLERMNKWMYISDSPFIEKWYCKHRWKKILAENEFNSISIVSINIMEKFPLLNRYYCITSTKQ